jgi:hypothetical protein
MSKITLITAQQLHKKTDSILEKLSEGKSFRILRDGKVIGRLQPAGDASADEWKKIMAPVWAAQKKVSKKTRNPVLAERERRRDGSKP